MAKDKRISVGGYKRKDGTRVKGYKRERPNVVCNHCGRYKDKCICPK